VNVDLGKYCRDATPGSKLPSSMTGALSFIDLVDFGNGQPALSLLPLRELRLAADDALARGDATLLQYGVDPGDEGFRDSLAQFLTRRYEKPVIASDLMVSAGISQALDLICTRFTQPGETIFVEAPTYFLALDVFRDHRLNVVGIPIDEDGLRADLLRDALTRHRAAFLYTIPSFQNPSGLTMSAERRAQLWCNGGSTVCTLRRLRSMSRETACSKGGAHIPSAVCCQARMT